MTTKNKSMAKVTQTSVTDTERDEIVLEPFSKGPVELVLSPGKYHVKTHDGQVLFDIEVKRG